MRITEARYAQTKVNLYPQNPFLIHTLFVSSLIDQQTLRGGMTRAHTHGHYCVTKAIGMDLEC
jgi:hypothetical protein